MYAVSSDLRKRIVEKYLRGGSSYEAIAEQFSVGRATVVRLIQRVRSTGSFEPNPPGGGNPARVAPEDFPKLRKLVEEHPDWIVAQYAAEWERRHKVSVSRSAMHRALRRAALSLKKSHSAQASKTDKTSKSVAKTSGTKSSKSQ